MLYLTEYASPLGMLSISCSKQGLVGLWIEGQKYFQSTLTGKEVKTIFIELDDVKNHENRNPAVKFLTKTISWLERYFRGEKPEIGDLLLDPQGSEFRKLVWKNLCEIPYGEVITYGELAKKVAVQMGKESMSAQAIGGAVGHNPISIIIPCHRVVGADGSLTGYAGGVEKKKWLLEMEKENF